MKLKHLVPGGILVFASGMLAGGALLADPPPPVAGVKVVLDNARVAVKQITIGPGAQRPPRVRETDEVVLFCEEAHYRAVKADGTKEPRDRQPGTVVFHSKGEQAPTLVNDGKRPVRYFSLSLK